MSFLVDYELTKLHQSLLVTGRAVDGRSLLDCAARQMRAVVFDEERRHRLGRAGEACSPAVWA